MRTRTDDLIAGLSLASPKKVLGPTGAVAVSALAAAGMAVVLSIAWLGPRDDLWPALLGENHVLVFKLVFTACVVAAALSLVRDLSVPGKRPGFWPVLGAIPLIAISALALHEPASAPVQEWSHHVEPGSWLECLWKIPALAIPALIILAFCVRYLAPTKLTLTGAFIGLAAGGIGAVGYAFHCHEDSIAFVVASYTLAISEMTLIGALAGPIILHWTSASIRTISDSQQGLMDRPEDRPAG